MEGVGRSFNFCVSKIALEVQKDATKYTSDDKQIMIKEKNMTMLTSKYKLGGVGWYYHTTNLDNVDSLNIML